MQLFAIKIGIAILNFIYFFIKLFPIQKNKVTFISRQTNSPSIDFSMLVKELEEQDGETKIVVLCKRLENGIKNKIGYCFHMLKQMYHIATSKVVILDSYCIPVCILKQKSNLVVIQIWHALGSLKKFGYSSLDKKDGRNSKMARVMKMHKNYTHILTSSNISKKFFKEAFDAEEKQMKVMSIPRVDFLQSKEEERKVREKFFELYPEANNSKDIILYCPTQHKGGNIPIESIIKVLPFEKYNLMIKLHNGLELLYVDGKKIEKEPNFTGMELLHIGNYIVTDYSAIVYEATITKKPIYLYAYDYDTYVDERGFYIDYKSEMPGPICKDFMEIIEKIDRNYQEKEKEERFCKKYIENLDNSTEKLAKFVLEECKR